MPTDHPFSHANHPSLAQQGWRNKLRNPQRSPFGRVVNLEDLHICLSRMTEDQRKQHVPVVRMPNGGEFVISELAEGDNQPIFLIDDWHAEPETECPNCHNGTIGLENGRLVCRGECGNDFGEATPE